MSCDLRVLHIVTDMGRGGLETMIMNYYRKIDRNKIQFDFLVHRKKRGSFDEEIEKMGGKIYRLSKLNPFGYEYLKELEVFFREHREYKIVHSHIDCMSSIPLKVAKKAGVPIRIAHSHSSNQERNYKYFLKMYYKSKIPLYATDLFACGETAGKWMFGKNDFFVFPNAINTNKYQYNPMIRIRMRNELKVNDNLVLGHIANFTHAKNHSFLIDIFETLCKKKSNVKLLLVGSGPELSFIKRKVSEKQLDNKVMFLGTRSDVENILQAVDVFILPSLYEGFPVTTLEAQTAGLPCLISDKVPKECKVTELVQQISLEQSVEEWVEKILAFENYTRKNYADKIKESGYDIEENALKLESLYKQFNMK